MVWRHPHEECAGLAQAIDLHVTEAERIYGAPLAFNAGHHVRLHARMQMDVVFN